MRQAIAPAHLKSGSHTQLNRFCRRRRQTAFCGGKPLTRNRNQQSTLLSGAFRCPLCGSKSCARLEIIVVVSMTTPVWQGKSAPSISAIVGIRRAPYSLSKRKKVSTCSATCRSRRSNPVVVLRHNELPSLSKILIYY